MNQRTKKTGSIYNNESIYNQIIKISLDRFGKKFMMNICCMSFSQLNLLEAS